MPLNLSFEALEDTSQILYLLNLVYRLQYHFVDRHNILIIITQKSLEINSTLIFNSFSLHTHPCIYKIW